MCMLHKVNLKTALHPMSSSHYKCKLEITAGLLTYIFVLRRHDIARNLINIFVYLGIEAENQLVANIQLSGRRQVLLASAMIQTMFRMRA